MASKGEANLLRLSRGLIRPLPGGNGPVNTRRMEELSLFIETLQNAVDTTPTSQARMDTVMAILREAVELLSDEDRRDNAEPLLQEVRNVFQMVAVKVLEIRGARAMRNVLRIATPIQTFSGSA